MTDTTSLQFQINRKTIVANIATLFSGSAIAQAITAVTFILTARQLGPDQYGQYTGSMVFATFCSIVFSLGLNLLLLYEGGRSPQKIGNLTGSILLIKVAIGIIWLVIMFVIAELIDSRSLPGEFVRLASVIIWLNSMFTTVLTGFKAILRNKINVVLDIGSVLAMFIFTLVLIAMGINDATRFMQARSVVYLISLLIAFALALYLLGLRSNRKTTQNALRNSPPYAASEFLAWTYMRVDILIIMFMLNEYAVGLYAPAEGIINALYLVPLTIHLVMVPVLSNLFMSKVTQAWLTSKRMMLVLVVVGLGMFIALFFGAKYFILLLGTAYAGSQEILQILSIILFIHSLTFGVAAILVATNQQTKRSIIQAIAVVINIGLNFLVIERWGIIGVAWVFVLTEIVLLLGYTWLVLRYRSATLHQPTNAAGELG